MRVRAIFEKIQILASIIIIVRCCRTNISHSEKMSSALSAGFDGSPSRRSKRIRSSSVDDVSEATVSPARTRSPDPKRSKQGEHTCLCHLNLYYLLHYALKIIIIIIISFNINIHVGVHLAATVENDPKKIQARLKQIGFGKNTVGYDNYTAAVPR